MIQLPADEKLAGKMIEYLSKVNSIVVEEVNDYV